MHIIDMINTYDNFTYRKFYFEFYPDPEREFFEECTVYNHKGSLSMNNVIITRGRK